MKRYGLIGKSLKHSFSQGYFSDKFKSLGLDAAYENFELEHISEINEVFQNQDLCGLNVTIPYKTEIIPFLDELSSEAEAIGAVNTVAFKDGKTIGHNTDWIGFRDSIKPFLALGMEKALILGTGGASKAVAYALKPLGIELLYASTNPSGMNQFAYSEINETAIGFLKLIINTTPIGMYPNVEECPPLPYSALTENHLLYDLIYNPAETAFLKEGKKHGAETVNGLSMLRIQAERSWEIWNRD